MITKVFGPILLAGAAAVAMAFAPTAGADNETQCSDNGLSSVCTKSGHANIVATPGTTAGGASYWPLGGGPTPPVWAMD